MQEQLVYSTFSRARQSVISRTRRAFTPRGLIKEGAENADKDIGVDKPPVGQDLEEVMHSEPKAPAPDRVKASRQEQTRDYMAQITTLEKRIKELEENKAEYAKSREGLTRQVADYERKVKDLEAENHGSTERLSSYTKQIEKLEDTIENSRSNESDHQARVKNYQAQLDELGKEVDELQKAQLRFDHTNVSVENLKREIELRDETIDNRKKEIGVLTSNLGQLKNQVEEQRNIIATQKQSMEGKQTEIALLQQTAREQVKDHGQNRDELRNKDIEISRLQAAIGQAKEAAAKAQTLDSNQKMEELRKKDSEISKLQNEAKQQVEDSNQKMNDLRDKDIEISQLQKVAKAQAEQFDQKMAELRNKDVEISQLRVAIEEAKEAAVEKQAKDTQQNSDDLRQKDMEIFQLQQAIVEAKESTPKNANSMPNMPLQRSEDEIIRDWQVLADLVEKFVSDAFGEVEFKQIRRWVRAQGVERLPAHSSPLVVGDVYTSRLVEAAIWNNLSQLVFGQSSLDSGMCWAGSSASKVSKLSKYSLPPSTAFTPHRARYSVVATYGQGRSEDAGLVPALEGYDNGPLDFARSPRWSG